MLPMLQAEVLAARQRLMKQLASFLDSRGSTTGDGSSPFKTFEQLLKESLGQDVSRPQQMTAIQLQQALLMVLAGYETSSSTLAFACYLLARPENRAMQLTLAKEVATAKADIMTLPYLDAVVKETLRVLPPAHLTVRRAHRELDVGGTVSSPPCAAAVQLLLVSEDGCMQASTCPRGSG